MINDKEFRENLAKLYFESVMGYEKAEASRKWKKLQPRSLEKKDSYMFADKAMALIWASA